MQQQVLGNVYSAAMSQFSSCRQPWNSYIKMLTREDSQPFAAPLYDKPAYRGRKNGRESWVFNAQSQMHYHMYSDERIFANLTRWRQGDTVGNLAIQQFRSTQPFDIENKDPHGHNTVDAETYAKLNYKNPLTFSRFLTRTGSMYPNDVLPLTPEAILKVRRAKLSATRLGLYPRAGNPFWHRTQQFRPKPNDDTYDPLSHKTKAVMEQFAFNWLQTDRVRTYFRELETAANSATKSSASSGGAAPNGVSYKGLYSTHRIHYDGDPIYTNDATPFSVKNPTVPGLMSTTGMKRKLFMYSGGTKKRMGFTNPLFGLRKN